MVLLCIAAILLCNLSVSNAQDTAQNFAKDFGTPLYESMGGYSGFEGGLGPVLKASEDDPDFAADCFMMRSSSDECSYLTFLAYCCIFGIIVVPVITMFCCCGFCCGRCCKACACCCKPCGQEACCNNTFTRKEIPTWEMGLTFGCLFISWLAVLSFSAVGFASFAQLEQEGALLVDGAVNLYQTPSLLRQDIDSSMEGIKDKAIGFVETDVNPKFNRLNDVRASLDTIRARMEEMKGIIEELQFFVEGCAEGVAPEDCTVANRAAVHNACASGETEHANNGVGVVMDNAATSPQCTAFTITGELVAAPCPCCENCISIIADIDAVIQELPGDEEIDEVDQPIDTADLQAQFDDATSEWSTEMDNMEESTKDLKFIEEGEQEMKDYLSEGNVKGAAALFFVLAWIICILVVAGLVLGFMKMSAAGVVLYTAFVLGVLYFIIIICPAFGLWSLIAIPFGDVCDALPGKGGSSEALVSSLPEETAGEVTDFLDGCLFDGDKYLWPLVDMTKDSFKEELGDFGSDRIDRQQIDDNLAVADYTADYDLDDIEDMNSNEGTYGITTTCPSIGAPDCPQFVADMEEYSGNIQTRIALIKPLGADIQAEIDSLKATATLMSEEFNEVLDNSDKLVDDMINDAWEIGRCTRMNDAYEQLRHPMCDRISPVFVATWAALFMTGIFLPILLCSIAKAAKFAHRHRTPEGEREGGGVAPGEEGAAQGKPVDDDPSRLPKAKADNTMEAPPSVEPVLSPSTTYAQDRPFSEDSVASPGAPVFTDPYNQPQPHINFNDPGPGPLAPGMPPPGMPPPPAVYGAPQPVYGGAQPLYPYIDRGMA